MDWNNYTLLLEDNDNAALICRICQEPSSREELISPCACAGSIKWVHAQCLNQWRQSGNQNRLFKCEICGNSYKIKDADSHRLAMFLYIAGNIIMDYALFALFLVCYFLAIFSSTALWLLLATQFSMNHSMKMPTGAQLLIAALITSVVFIVLTFMAKGLEYLVGVVRGRDNNGNACLVQIRNMPLYAQVIILLISFPSWVLVGMFVQLHEMIQRRRNEYISDRTSQFELFEVIDLEANNHGSAERPQVTPLHIEESIHSSMQLSSNTVENLVERHPLLALSRNNSISEPNASYGSVLSLDFVNV